MSEYNNNADKTNDKPKSKIKPGKVVEDQREDPREDPREGKSR